MQGGEKTVCSLWSVYFEKLQPGDNVCFSFFPCECVKRERLCFPVCMSGFVCVCVFKSRGREKRMLSCILTPLIYYTLHGRRLCDCVCVFQ